MNPNPSVLVIDDERHNFDVIEALLSQEGYQLQYAASGQRALERLDRYRPDVILLDVMMPGLDGIEVCRRIKALSEWQSVPIIIVTALTAKEDLANCLSTGADDFLSKPINGLELRARVRSMLRIREQYLKLESFNAVLEEAVQQRTAQLQDMIFQDSLTQLPSRTFLLQKVGEALQANDSPFALVYLDCDQFKLVNGSLGYDVGNQLLIAISERLKAHLRPGDVLARIGEDEFCFLLAQVPSVEAVQPLTQAVLSSFDAPFTVAGYEIFVTACLGVALGSNTQQPHEFLQSADTAMYKAKLQGKGCCQIFDHAMHQATLQRLTLENDLRRALERQEFVTYYQPIVDLQAQKIVGFEALVRWRHPERGLVPPAEFIPCLEETGLIVPAGLLILKQACQQLSQWQQQGLTDLTISVNLSVRQFAHPTLLEDIDRVLVETDIDPISLKLEITESAIMDNPQIAIDLTKQLRSRGIHLSIDDFGTGYSSLSYLSRFPVDSLKIDRSFTQGLGTSPHDTEIVQAIVSLGHALGISLVAEGIETTEQLTYLQQLGSEYGQGYLFSRPLALEQATALLIPVQDWKKLAMGKVFEPLH
ncbi:MAG TPA: EAL domain-containing protein [Leptolyngbyaceae cyanobacterium]